ncbi:PEP-CTERM sorting domain-containing protein [Aeoliella mucimassa]|uniref:Ice-binding protein C-terminal domain-containing protein n=1 Tax=Aeoliella mucimassa TaxID=2527972 RepID=A0A518AVE9_9BACT|nr:PEP-CTERM sorting domain-containing protein [Aeoliella mucimassa]QDU58686.1 hypothetical protein Pan181_49260 [Aeoliella mucimassa]
MMKIFGLAAAALCCVGNAFAGTYVPRADDSIGGRIEWEEWSFVNSTFWVDADNQGRDQFTKAQGVFAVADPDEWDDSRGPAGMGAQGPNGEDIGYNTQLMSPTFDVIGTDILTINFDYSWRPEDTQQAFVRVQFDDGSDIVLLDLNTGNSVDSDDPLVNLDLNANYNDFVEVPATATTATLAFEMVDAGNDWWFAVDNISAESLFSSSVILSEDFESLASELGPGLDEVREGSIEADVIGWTQTPPTGWMINTDDFVSTGPMGSTLGATGVYGITRVPEPSTCVLAGLAILGLAAFRRKQAASR